VRAVALVVLALTLAAPALAADPLAEARRLYNSGQYEEAEKLARELLEVPGAADGARVVLGRILLERYRRTADTADLTSARETLKAVDPSALDPREQVEYVIGLGESLYLEDRFGAAAQLFESVLSRAAVLGTSSRERVLDWWATALDRQAQTRPAEERGPIYARILERMRIEIADHQGSTAAGYWLAAAARGMGDLEQAWQAAVAGWVRAVLAEDRGAALRADLNRLVVQAILPERAAKLPMRGDLKQALSVMLSEWEAFKAAWSK
jgi:tetratricopeptide (TPR) repeat protein